MHVWFFFCYLQKNQMHFALKEENQMSISVLNSSQRFHNHVTLVQRNRREGLKIKAGLWPDKGYTTWSQQSILALKSINLPYSVLISTYVIACLISLSFKRLNSSVTCIIVLANFFVFRLPIRWLRQEQLSFGFCFSLNTFQRDTS